MEGMESVLEAILEEDGELGGGGEDETLDGDVEMLDAGTIDGGDGGPAASEAGDGGGREQVAEGGLRSKSQRRRANKKRNRRNRKGGDRTSVTGINRFVIDTCRQLKEKKSYLLWNAVGVLGVSTVRDLVKEVDAIQSCGGQKTADGKRLRTGGGILWNILKTREPKAYKDIMAKGREFEKQFRHTKGKQMMHRRVGAASEHFSGEEEMDRSEPVANGQQEQGLESSDQKQRRKSVLDRIRVPVAYDDLFEEGEIHEST